MHRRTALNLFGATAAALAGCMTGGSGESDTRDNGTTTNASKSSTTGESQSNRTDSRDGRETTTTCSGNLDIPSQPILTTDYSALEGPCPQATQPSTRKLCIPAIDEETPLRFERDSESGTLPSTEFTFTLSNQSTRPFWNHSGTWRLSKYTDGGWVRIARGTEQDALGRIGPGERREWLLTVDNSNLRDANPRPPAGGDSIRAVGLGAGHYAFTVDGYFETISDDQEYYELSARFRFQGDPLALWPTRGVDSVTCHDGTVEATATRPTKMTRARFELERISATESSSATNLLAEEVFHRRHLRDAIVLSRTFNGASVSLIDDSAAIPVQPDEPIHVGFLGDEYRFAGSSIV